MDDPVPWPWQVFRLDPKRLTRLEKVALGVAALLTFLVLLLSLLDLGRYAGIDLRNRIVGARVLLTGQDPYTFVWQPGMPLELLDPCHDFLVHRLTAPPPTLFLYAPIAPLPYKAERLVSFVLEWLSFALSVALLTRTIADMHQRVTFLLLTVLCFVLSGFWRLHLERGQVYAFHLLVLSGAVVLSLRHHLDSWSGGILFGLAALLRLNYLLFVPAFLLLRQWRTGLGASATFLAGVLATVPFMHPGSWASYHKVGDEYYLTLWAPERLPKRPPPQHEGPVEDVNFGSFLDEAVSTSFGYFYHKGQSAGLLPIIDLGLVSKGIMSLLGLTLLGLLWRRRREPLHPRLVLALIVCFALDTEFFLPHRWSYVDVVLLLPIALLWPFLWATRWGRMLLGFIVSMCLLGQFTLYGTTLARSWLVMGSLTGLALVRWFRRDADEHRVTTLSGMDGQGSAERGTSVVAVP